MTATLEDTVIRSREIRLNLAPGSRAFDCRFIEPGLVAYYDQKKGGMELVTKETLDRCMPSVVGNPVTIGHHRPEELEDRSKWHGVVTDWRYNAEDGWYYVKGTLDTDEAADRIRRGERASCGYAVTARESAVGKTYHGIRYDTENTGLQFYHLAIVPKGRYEGAEFRLNHINVSDPNMKILKLLRKLVTRENGADGNPVETTKVESTDVSGDTTVEIDGQEVRLNELVEMHQKQNAPKPPKVGADDEVEIDGKTVKVGDLVTAYRDNAAAKKQEGQQAFQQLHQAREQGGVVQPTGSSNSMSERLARGKQNY